MAEMLTPDRKKALGSQSAKPDTRPRTTTLLQHPPHLSFEEKDAVSALGQLSMTRPLSATNKASRPQQHHRRGSVGTLISFELHERGDSVHMSTVACMKQLRVSGTCASAPRATAWHRIWQQIWAWPSVPRLAT